MTIAGTSLTADAFSTTAPWTSSSYTPAANALLLATVLQIAGTGPPTLTGNGLTWTLAESVGSNFLNTQMWVFRALGASPAAGALTASFASQPTFGTIHVAQFTGVDTTAGGGGAIVQVAHDSAYNETGIKPSATSLTVTMASTPAATSATFGAFYSDQSPATAPTVGSGYTQLGSNSTSAGPRNVLTEWQGGSHQSASASSGSVVRWQGIAIELAIDTSVPAAWTIGELRH